MGAGCIAGDNNEKMKIMSKEDTKFKLDKDLSNEGNLKVFYRQLSIDRID
jgi:hypothetical protein